MLELVSRKGDCKTGVKYGKAILGHVVAFMISILEANGKPPRRYVRKDKIMVKIA